MNRRGFLRSFFPSLALMVIGPSCLLEERPRMVQGWRPLEKFWFFDLNKDKLVEVAIFADVDGMLYFDEVDEVTP